MRRSAGPLLPGQKPVMGKREADIGQSMHSEIADLANEWATYDVYLHDNRSNTNREPDEPTLFVGGKPHEVRPLADSSVFYNLDMKTKDLKISLEDPVLKPQYEIDSVLPLTAHKLCLNCLDALNYFCRYREQQAKNKATDKKSSPNVPNCVIHHANLFTLLAQAEIDRCHICWVIHRRLERWDLAYSQYEDYRIEFAFPQKIGRGLSEDDLLVFAMVRSDTKKEPVWNWSVLFELRLWPEDNYLHHFQAQLTRDDLELEEYQSMSPDELSINNSPLTRGITKSWLRKCMTNENGKHVECNRQDHDYLPSRLLDVRHAAEKSYLRIVCPQDDPSRFEKNRKYATLSHCWGSWGASENPSLTMENLEVRKAEGLSCDTLPLTFRHVLEVAGWLNIPYLWIDSLCIIQDSRPDWIHEASLMHHTYQSSTINISASHGTDSRSGLFFERDPLFITAQQLQAPNIPISWYVTRDNVFGWTTVSPAFSRAWIHRERQLAPRILHFMSGEVVWECSGTDGASFASETLPGGAPFKELWNGNSKYQSTSTIVKSKQGRQMTYALWNELCETFSTKELTVKSDMPIIMSSLAQEFHRSLPGDEYLAGMWRDTLPQALAWHTNRSWPENDTNDIAPTWSWLSAPAPIGVAFVKKVRMEQLIPLAKLVDVDIVREDEYEHNEYGPVKSGTLRLEGFMRKIWFSFDDKGGFELSVADTLIDGEEDDNSKTTLREVGKNWDEYEGDMCEVEFDGKIKDDEYCCWCMFTCIEESMSDRNEELQSREITAILLEQSGDDDEGPWIRTGMMRMRDLFAFKMRYKACWELDNDSDEEEEVEPGNADQSVSGHDHNDADDGEMKDLQQRPEENGNKPIDTTPEENTDKATTDNPEIKNPQTEQSPPETNQNTSVTEDNTSETIPKAQPENETDQTKSSSETRYDPWPRLASFIQRKRFEVCQAEEAAKKALKDEKATKLDNKSSNNKDGASQNKDNEDENTTANKNDRDPPEPTTKTSVQQTPSALSLSDQSDTPQGPQQHSNLPNPEATTDTDHSTTPNQNTTNLPPPDPTPICGHTNLDPSEALYQFDHSLAQIQEEGYFKWLRRLDVRKIEII